MPDKEEEVDACGRATSASETRSVEDELQYRDVDRPRIDHVDHSPATDHYPPEVTRCRFSVVDIMPSNTKSCIHAVHMHCFCSHCCGAQARAR